MIWSVGFTMWRRKGSSILPKMSKQLWKGADVMKNKLFNVKSTRNPLNSFYSEFLVYCTTMHWLSVIKLKECKKTCNVACCELRLSWKLAAKHRPQLLALWMFCNVAAVTSQIQTEHNNSPCFWWGQNVSVMI